MCWGQHSILSEVFLTKCTAWVSSCGPLPNSSVRALLWLLAAGSLGAEDPWPLKFVHVATGSRDGQNQCGVKAEEEPGQLGRVWALAQQLSSSGQAPAYLKPHVDEVQDTQHSLWHILEIQQLTLYPLLKLPSLVKTKQLKWGWAIALSINFSSEPMKICLHVIKLVCLNFRWFTSLLKLLVTSDSFSKWHKEMIKWRLSVRVTNVSHSMRTLNQSHYLHVL